MFFGNANSLSNCLNKTSKWEDIAHCRGQSTVLCHHGAQRNGVLELAGPDQRAVIQANDEACLGLDRSGVCPRFLSVETTEVTVHMHVHEQSVDSRRLQDHALVLGSPETLAYLDEGQFMGAPSHVFRSHPERMRLSLCTM